MDVLHTCCSGLDVHKETVVTCLIHAPEPGPRRKELRAFSTTTAALEHQADWLRAAGCTHVAFECTGAYWQTGVQRAGGPVHGAGGHVAHTKAVPGWKPDVEDCKWIADLLQHGRLRASFILGRAQRKLRDPTRTRTTLIDERSAAVWRPHKVLEDTNPRVGGLAAEVLAAEIGPGHIHRQTTPL